MSWPLAKSGMQSGAITQKSRARRGLVAGHSCTLQQLLRGLYSTPTSPPTQLLTSGWKGSSDGLNRLSRGRSILQHISHATRRKAHSSI